MAPKLGKYNNTIEALQRNEQSNELVYLSQKKKKKRAGTQIFVFHNILELVFHKLIKQLYY